MRAFSTLEFTSKVDSVWYMMRRIYEQAAKVINGNISFGDGSQSDNIAGRWATTVTPLVPGTDFTIVHNLGYVPSGYLLMSSDVPVNLSDGTTPPSTTDITLKADAASATIKVFIL